MFEPSSLERHARPEGHGHAHAGVDERVRRVGIHPARSARGENDGIGLERFEVSARHIQRDHAAAHAVLDDERGDQPLIVYLQLAALGGLFVFDDLLVEREQQHVPGLVDGETGTRKARAAERPLRYLAVGRAIERAAPMLHLDDAP